MKKRILLSFGTRPEAIKMAPLIHALKALPNDFEAIVCVTAQHREMLDQALEIFSITPDFDLNLMRRGQDLHSLTGEMLIAMRDVIQKTAPNLLLVHGDTTSTFASAIAGFYSNLPVGHIEAGLRTGNILQPFPEEFNRQVVSKIAKWNFAPTERSKLNLLKEGVNPGSIFVTGNTVIDSLYWILQKLDLDDSRRNRWVLELSGVLGFDWQSKPFVLITGHRRENHGDNFIQICKALKQLAHRFKAVEFVYPVHPNPAIYEAAHRLLGSIDNIYLIEPLEYEPFILLLKAAYIILTDSGGIQEEAPSLKKPVLVMRDTTERPEGVEAGAIRLVGTDADEIIKNVSELLTNNILYQDMINSDNPYGDGTACQKIISILKDC
ncbi:UDP-N-acetylglucosamine 2-epimerase (non-hydrolyzing) [Polynucleobacter tropicus]|uniref:UDP-N-acetylglucosamine 2-epimerase (non-hydrolyzing) n=1 Tax=Polynucleobacter tropicus TaxID=1743174 RepID=A0A6M9Q331_9BURK|nr:UDP-N-acetylglucosamine 2-epimerase (non-hydrolyzing) [Polynucleobacter tropicus]